MVIPSCLVLLTALAWTYLVHLDHQMTIAMKYDRAMADMGMTMDMPWRAADVFFTFAMWVVMMVAMMAASAAPVMLFFAGMHTGRGGKSATRVFAFGAGYLLVWFVFSAVATLTQWALHHWAMLSPSMRTSSGRLGGAILVAAGVYQLTPFKGACLAHCRSPLGFLMSNWREGQAGALRMGIEHGTYCLGCCWALMCVLFVVGVMNLVWVAAMTIVVLLEKSGPAGAFVARAAGVAMIAAGVLVWRASL